MKKLVLIVVFIFISVNAFALFGFKKKIDPETEESIIKRCFYQMEVREGVYGVFVAFQQDCNGITLVGVVSGRRIIEYGEDMKQSNTQTPTDDDTFRSKIKALWPNLQEIKFRPAN